MAVATSIMQEQRLRNEEGKQTSKNLQSTSPTSWLLPMAKVRKEHSMSSERFSDRSPIQDKIYFPWSGITMAWFSVNLADNILSPLASVMQTLMAWTKSLKSLGYKLSLGLMKVPSIRPLPLVPSLWTRRTSSTFATGPTYPTFICHMADSDGLGDQTLR